MRLFLVGTKSNGSRLAPPPPSAEELKQQEAIASQTVYGALATCVLLYLCMFSTMRPFGSHHLFAHTNPDTKSSSPRRRVRFQARVKQQNHEGQEDSAIVRRPWGHSETCMSTGCGVHDQVGRK